eukprot:85275-Amphidinium_carterae.1
MRGEPGLAEQAVVSFQALKVNMLPAHSNSDVMMTMSNELRHVTLLPEFAQNLREQTASVAVTLEGFPQKGQ